MGDLFSNQALALWSLVAVPMLALSVVWWLRRRGRARVDATSAVLLWATVAQMVVAFGLGAWMLRPEDRVYGPASTVVGTEVLGVLLATGIVLVDVGLWRVIEPRLPHGGDDE